MVEGLLEPVQAMTVGGWVPWLANTFDPESGQVAFHTYVRQDSVILTRVRPAATTSCSSRPELFGLPHSKVS